MTRSSALLDGIPPGTAGPAWARRPGQNAPKHTAMMARLRILRNFSLFKAEKIH